jgi:hypothetical protein
MSERRRGWVFVVAAGLLASGCLYYDSRWGSATAEQKHNAARLHPASLASPRAEGEATRRRASVRACATRAYAAETLGWEERFDELVRNANSVLGPSLGLELTNAGTTLWQPARGEGGLATVIDDLRSCEGAESDWVVALVQSTPKVISDFHILGRGAMYSPYLAIRASNDPAEIESFTKAFPDLDEATRQQLYSDRKRHKTLSVFLHEVGHTLGAIHRLAKDTIMSASYNAAERGYDEPTLTLLKSGLEIRLDRANSYAEARKYLEANESGFVKSELFDQLSFLRQWERHATPPSPAAAAPAPVAPSPETHTAAVGFETLPKRDRQTFDEALELESTSAHDAWTVASPLFEAYPAVRAVQELRCRLAKARKFFPGVIEAHCARLAALGADEN